MAAEFRDRVYAAAHDELARWGIDRFSIPALADRHRIDADTIYQLWADEATLIVDVLLGDSNQKVALPDTGSLRGDLTALAMGMAAYVSSAAGHRVQSTHLIADPQLRSVGIRSKLWETRVKRMSVVFDRARDRGELRAGIDAATALELLFAPINMRALFTGYPIDEPYCRTISEAVWRAIAADD